jgi:hypothetical protein
MGPASDVVADKQVTEHCGVLKKLDILKSPRNATPGNLMRDN